MAFSGITIVDGGYTGFGRGGRSSPALEGQGLGFKLIEHSVEWAKKRGIKKANATELLTKDTVRKHLLEYDVVVSKVYIYMCR